MKNQRPFRERIKDFLSNLFGWVATAAFILFFGALYYLPMRSSKPMTFEYVGNGGNCNGCEWIAAEGRITLNTAKQFRKFLKENSINHPLAVLLNSNGGSVVGAMDLGRVFNERGFRIYVGKTIPDGNHRHMETKGQCLNECVVAFLGGKDRTGSEGELGAKNILNSRSMEVDGDKRFEGLKEADKQREISAMLVNYLVDMGADPRFFSIVSAKKGEKLFTKSLITSLKLNASTKPVTSWSLEPYNNGLVVVNKDQDGMLYGVISCGKGDSTPKLFLNIGTNEDFDYFNEEIQYHKEVYLGETTVAAGGFRLSKGLNKSILEIDIPDLSIFEGNKNDGLSISFATSIHKMSQFSWNFPNKGLDKMVASALKQCID